MHQERVDRHSKGITITLNEFKTRFHTMIEEHNEEVKHDNCFKIALMVSLMMKN